MIKFLVVGSPGRYTIQPVNPGDADYESGMSEQAAKETAVNLNNQFFERIGERLPAKYELVFLGTANCQDIVDFEKKECNPPLPETYIQNLMNSPTSLVLGIVEGQDLISYCAMEQVANKPKIMEQQNIVVPDKCSVKVDIRTLPGQSSQHIVADFERILAGLKSQNPQFDAEVSMLREMHPLETDCGCDFVTDFCSCVGAAETNAINFATDAPHFVPLGAPAVIFGPGKPALCHRPDEYIDVADLEKAAEYYRRVILSFLT